MAAQSEKLLKSLAVALVDHPRGTLKDLAAAAGVSKATLHRFCNTRDNLIEMLMAHAESVLGDVIESAELDRADARGALPRLINEHLAHRELLVFMMFQYRPDSLDPEASGGRWQAYMDALDAFFLRGQRQGAFRIDVTAEALTELFASLLYGVVDAERRGRLAAATSAAVMEKIFLHGAADTREGDA